MEKQIIDTENIVKKYLEGKLDIYFRKLPSKNDYDRYVVTHKKSDIKDLIEVCVNTGTLKLNGKIL